ncbi:hypothetical protein Goarm_011068 [Gossypium armourianum]|uniref:RNase H type-1 domain-containing protein n=1 Tax=Gossypium armourianum TaxID=34283 RepID=A0A7J9IVP1_9ROSI|nr:hypothetical protein [Gossypium armourianum]
MALCTYPWDNIMDPKTVEARGSLKVVSFAEELGFRDMCVKGDALTIIQKLKSSEEDRSSIRGPEGCGKDRFYKEEGDWRKRPFLKAKSRFEGEGCSMNSKAVEGFSSLLVSKYAIFLWIILTIYWS